MVLAFEEVGLLLVSVSFVRAWDSAQDLLQLETLGVRGATFGGKTKGLGSGPRADLTLLGGVRDVEVLLQR